MTCVPTRGNVTIVPNCFTVVTEVKFTLGNTLMQDTDPGEYIFTATVINVRPDETFSGKEILGYTAATTVDEVTTTAWPKGPVVAVALANKGAVFASAWTNDPVLMAVVNEVANEDTSNDEFVGAPVDFIVIAAFHSTFTPADNPPILSWRKCFRGEATAPMSSDDTAALDD